MLSHLIFLKESKGSEARRLGCIEALRLFLLLEHFDTLGLFLLRQFLRFIFNNFGFAGDILFPSYVFEGGLSSLLQHDVEDYEVAQED